MSIFYKISKIQSINFVNLLALLINIITWLIVAFKIRPTAELIPLHYNIFYGTDFTARGYLIYFIPSVGVCIFLANYLFYRFSISREEFAGQILAGVSLFVQLIILLAIFFLKSIIV